MGGLAPRARAVSGRRRPSDLARPTEGRSLPITVQLGSVHHRIESHLRVFTPRPELHFDFDFPWFEGPGPRTPLLGITAEDLSGQLGAYFGVPEGEGILVKEVRSGSPAEKAGLKAGDVITKVDSSRVKTTSELRSALREKRDQKAVSLGVIRKGSEVSLSVEIEHPKPSETRRIARRVTL